MRYNFAAGSFYIDISPALDVAYIMNTALTHAILLQSLWLAFCLCSRLFVLYCRSRPKDDKSRHFDPHFEEVRGGVEPWWMARWKARAEFLLSVVELLFLYLTVEALQGKMCQDSLPSGVGRSLGAKISGEGVVPGEYFLWFLQN